MQPRHAARASPRSARRRCAPRPRNPARRALADRHVIAAARSRTRAARPSGAPRRCRSRRARPAPSRAAGSAVRAATARAPACTALSSRSAVASSRGQALALGDQRRRCPRRGPWPCRPPWRWHCAPRAAGPAPPGRACAVLERLQGGDIEREAAAREIARDGLRVGAQQLRIDHCPAQPFLGSRRTQSRQRLADLDLEPARHRPIVSPIRHLIRQVALAGRVGVRLIVRVAVVPPVAEVLHQPRRRIAQLQRHLQRAELARRRPWPRPSPRTPRCSWARRRDRPRHWRWPARPPGCRGARRPPRHRASARSARGSASPMSSIAMRTTRRAT